MHRCPQRRSDRDCRAPGQGCGQRHGQPGNGHDRLRRCAHRNHRGFDRTGCWRRPRRAGQARTCTVLRATSRGTATESAACSLPTSSRIFPARSWRFTSSDDSPGTTSIHQIPVTRTVVGGRPFSSPHRFRRIPSPTLRFSARTSCCTSSCISSSRVLSTSR